MRITNNIIRENALLNMRKSLAQMEESQQRVSTGLRFREASDDPGGAETSMRTRSSLRALDQYRAAIRIADLRAAAEESSLNQVGDLLARAKELAFAQGTGTADAATREQTRIEVDEILRHLVAIGNTEFDGHYLFGGNDADAMPYGIDDTGPTLEFTSTDPTGNHQVRIASQKLVTTNHSGLEVFGTTTGGVMAAVRDLGRALAANDAIAIKATIDDLDAAAQTVQTLVTDVGGRVSQIEVTRNNLDALETNLITLKSDLEEVDIEKAVTELVGRQTAYQAAMLATSRVMSLTLTDYLR